MIAVSPTIFLLKVSGECSVTTIIRLTVLTGPHKHQRYCFRGQTQCTVGRGSGCGVQLCGDERDECISRRHCSPEINPPLACIHDLGSTNGTYVNGTELRPSPVDSSGEPHKRATWKTLEEGDIITIGGTSLRVDFPDCPNLNRRWEGEQNVKRNCDLC